MSVAVDPTRLLAKVRGQLPVGPLPAPEPPEPGPVILTKEWPVLAPEALVGLAADVVAAIGPTTEADPVAVLATFLLSFGNAAGRSAWVEVGEDRHHGNLFAVLVGETSKARKGSSRGGVTRIMLAADEPWAMHRVQGGLSSGEGLIWAVRDPIERSEPVKEKGIVTGYQTVQIDPGVPDKRLLTVEEEFSSVLKQTQRQGNTVSETLRRAWDGRGVLAAMTKNAPARSTGAHVSLLGHITRDELVRTLTDTETANGLGNRHLWFLVRRSKAQAFLPRMPDALMASLARRVASALQLAAVVGAVEIGPEARDAWETTYPAVSAGMPGICGALTARAEAQVLRLALVYALLDCSRVVKLSHLRAALAVVEYVFDSVEYVFGDATGDPIADRILTAIRRNGEMAQGEIVDLFGRNAPGPVLGRALEALIAAGMVRSRQEETGGRPRTVWTAVAR